MDDHIQTLNKLKEFFLTIASGQENMWPLTISQESFGDFNDDDSIHTSLEIL